MLIIISQVGVLGANMTPLVKIACDVYPGFVQTSSRKTAYIQNLVVLMNVFSMHYMYFQYCSSVQPAYIRVHYAAFTNGEISN